MAIRLLEYLSAPGFVVPTVIVTDILTMVRCGTGFAYLCSVSCFLLLRNPLLSQAGHDVAEKLDIPLVILGSLPLYPILEMAGLHACNSPHDIPFESVMTCLPERMSWMQRKMLNPLMKV